MDFINLSLLMVFIPTFFFVSITPGMCMMLSFSLGLSIGLKKTFYMMYGELIGVGLVASSSVVGVAAIMLNYPFIFTILKYCGGAYLFYLGIQMFLSKGKMSINLDECKAMDISAKKLFVQGFVTAIANPKGWAFFIALLPPFIDTNLALPLQLATLVFMILLLEFFCLIIYASGGKTLAKFLKNSSNVRLLNKISGTLMMGIGVWLAFF